MVETMHGKAVVMRVAMSNVGEAMSGKAMELAIVKAVAEGGETAMGTPTAVRHGVDLRQYDNEHASGSDGDRFAQKRRTFNDASHR